MLRSLCHKQAVEVNGVSTPNQVLSWMTLLHSAIAVAGSGHAIETNAGTGSLYKARASLREIKVTLAQVRLE